MVNLFKKTISSVAAAAVVLTTSAATVQAWNSYWDVPSTAWFAPYVSALADAKVFDWSKSTFRPADTMNRAEFVKTLVTASWIELDAASAWFSDVSSDAWFAPYVNAAVEAWIIDGPMADKWNKFFPNDNISRAAATKIALWAFWINTADYQSPAAPFSDLNGHWGSEFVTAAYNLSIVDWKSATAFAPNDSIVRAAVSKIAAYTVIASADPATHVRFEDWTSAFSVYTAENISEKVSSIVTSTEESTDEEMNDDEDMTDDEEEVTTPVISDWSLEISLSSNSPKWAVVPYSVWWVLVAQYDITSNWDDVMLSSLLVKRTWLSQDDAVTSIAIYDENWRVTKAKSFTSSSDDATMTFLDWGLMIEAWETKTISIVAEVWSVTYKWNRFAMEIASASAITSNATEVVWDFPVTWSTFEIWSVPWAAAIIEIDWTASNPKLWADSAEVSKFKIKNNSSDESITLSSITLKENWSISEDDELENFELYADWSKISSVSKITWKYLTFNFDNALTLPSSKTVKFVVKADIVWWADSTIEFFLDNKLDVQAKWNKYGYWITLTNSLRSTDTSTISVEAWELTVIAIEPVNTEIRKDKDDLVAWKIKIVSAAWTNIELQQVAVTIDLDYSESASCKTDASTPVYLTWSVADLWDLIENVEMYDESTWTTYDLTWTITDWDKSTVFSDSDISIALNWNQTFAFRFDTKNASAISCAKITAKLESIWTDWWALYVEETQDDTAVTDITPSSISFKQITWKAATAVVTMLPLSDTKSSVIWSSDVVALDFEVKADDASALVIDEIKAQWLTKDVANATIATTTANVVGVAAVYTLDLSGILLNTNDKFFIDGVEAYAAVGDWEVDTDVAAAIDGDTITLSDTIDYLIDATDETAVTLTAQSDIDTEWSIALTVGNESTDGVSTVPTVSSETPSTNGVTAIAAVKTLTFDRLLTTTDKIAYTATAAVPAYSVTANNASIITDLKGEATISNSLVSWTWKVITFTAATAWVDSKLSNVILTSTATAAWIDNKKITEVKLWKKEWTNETLLDTISASQLASWVATFNWFNVAIAKSESARFVVTTSIVDDSNKASDTVQFKLVSLSVEDEDSDDVTATWDIDSVTADAWLSDRTITIRWAWSLTVSTDITDSATNKDKNVLWNTTSDFVASFELTAVNEPVKINDFYIVENSTKTLSSAVESISIYANDKTTLLATETVSADSVFFENINKVISEWSENIYVKVKTRKIWLNQAWSMVTDLDLNLSVTDAEWDASWKTVVAWYKSSWTITTSPWSKTFTVDTTTDSKLFSVIPVRVSNVQFVNSFWWETVSSELINWENTIAIIAITTEASDNINSTNGSSLKTELEDLDVVISSDTNYDKDNNNAWVDFTALTVEKIWWTVWAKAIAYAKDWSTLLDADGDANDVPTNLNLFKWVVLWEDKKVDNWTTSYYVVKATFSWLASGANKYVQLKLDALDDDWTFVYSSDNLSDASSDADDNISWLRIWTTSISWPSISSKY